MANQFSTDEGRIAAIARRDAKRRARYAALSWSAEYFQREFIESNRSLESLAQDAGVGVGTVRAALSFYGIVKDSSVWTQKASDVGTRNMKDPNSLLRRVNAERSEAERKSINLKAVTSRRRNRIAQLASQGITKESLTELYITQNKSLTQLTELFSVKEKVVRNWLKLFGIEKTQEQRDAAKLKAIEEFYSDPDKVAEITRKTQTTTRERYGNSWYRVTSSKEELAVEAFLKETFPEIQISRGDYSVIHKGGHGGALQLDFYFPKLSLAIEYNGEYWHDREAYEADIANGTELSRERMKDRLCSEKGIVLYQLWSSDWKKDSENARLSLVKLIESAMATR